jgi:hypothetical protein
MAFPYTRYLQELLTIFDVARLGEGDPVAGVNLLAAKACSIASIQRPGSGLLASDGDKLAVGTNLMVSGSLTTSLISGRVLNHLASRQNNFSAILRNRTRELKQEAEITQWPKPDKPTPLTPDFPESAIGSLCDGDSLMFHTDLSNVWERISETSALIGFDDLASHPMVFATGNSEETLNRQLERSHMGHPFVHVGMDGVADFARYKQTIPAIMDGLHPAAGMTENLHGTVVVTDPTGVLGEAIRTDLPHARWASRMLWLVDGNAGPEPCEPEDGKPDISLNRLAKRYDMAVTKAWGYRVNNHLKEPKFVTCDFHRAQAEWVCFLKTMEPEFPGITGTARLLWATVVFGLQLMVEVMPKPDACVFHSGHGFALARFLVHRMVNARAVMLHNAEDARRQQQLEDILLKLADGPQDHRALVRRFHRLPTQQCLHLLEQLEIAGRVIRIDRLWQLAESEVLTTTSRAKQLTLEA